MCQNGGIDQSETGKVRDAKGTDDIFKSNIIDLDLNFNTSVRLTRNEDST